MSKKALPLILVVSNKIVRETWWRKSHLRALKPSSKVLTHKNQDKVPSGYVRVRYGKGKASVAVLAKKHFQQLNGRRISK